MSPEHIDRILKSAKLRHQLERAEAIENRECMRCGGGLPEQNTVSNPITKETKESALCPDCRHDIVSVLRKEMQQ